jgi:porphobilinogen synthase
VEAGVDFVAPSDMMDGRVGAIRDALDARGTAASESSRTRRNSRQASRPIRGGESAPKFSDRCSYQMDPPNAREAMREIELDVAEGADMIMVKPALSYLGIIHEARLR